MPAFRRMLMAAAAASLALVSIPTAAAGAGPTPAGATVTASTQHDTSRSLRSMARSSSKSQVHPAKHLDQNNVQQQGPASPNTGGSATTPRVPSTTNNFAGIGANGSAPPDNDGAIGATQYLELVNSEIAVYSKSGATVLSPRNTNTLWSGFGGACETHNDGDGTVHYDQAAGRWFLQQFTIDTTANVYNDCVAVSTTSDATGTWNRYSFPFANFPDYPKTGVWADAYYASFNLFNQAGTTGLGADVCAFDRARMLGGQAATMQCFMATNSGESTFIPASIDGATAPPAGSPEWFVGLSPTSGNALGYLKFHVDWTTPSNSTLTGPVNLPVSAFTLPCSGGGTCIPQTGTTQRLDSLGDRVMFRLAYRNFGDHEALVINHSISAGSSVGVRWYELRPAGANLTVFQQGTYAPDSNYRWMGSIAMDHSGNMALGYSISSSSTHPGIAYTGRLAGDPAGTMPQGEATIITGGGSQTGSSLSRWGDYTEMTVDPVDDCTFWYVNQYEASNGAFNWSTRIASFKFAGCGGTTANDFSMSANPGSVSATQGGSATSSISTAVTSGTAQSVALSASGLPAGATASFNPASVTAGASSTLTIGTSASTPAGTYPITVTGTGPSATHTTTVTLTVSAVVTNDFSISASPAAVSTTQGQPATTTISTAVTSGSAQSLSLSASGLPAGATASFNPANVTAGASSTLTINTAPSTPVGTSTITVTGTGTQVHSTAVSLTVNPAGGGPVVSNGDFESGSFAGWTTGGAATAVVTPGHGGTYAARLGSSSPTNGNSTMQQTITVPSSGATLTAWYQPHCPDTLTYDQQQVQVRSTGGSTLATLLNVCDNAGTWKQLTADLSAYKGQTVVLWFNSHDDNYASDPTWILFDDVAVTASTPPPPPPSGITNGGFETGNLSGWSSTGTATAAAAARHSGSYGATLGSSSPTSGDSTIAQTFTAGAGSHTLSVFYQVHCPDTITYDWESITLRDNTGGTSTVLAKTCTNNNTWQSVSAAVTSGHSYTLTLLSHDDNYAGDPTYTYFDDVTLS